jgi:hypothetical protein
MQTLSQEPEVRGKGKTVKYEERRPTLCNN